MGERNTRVLSRIVKREVDSIWITDDVKGIVYGPDRLPENRRNDVGEGEDLVPMFRSYGSLYFVQEEDRDGTA